MAADILVYKADFVPVGEDQKQHLELTRDIAGIINRKFQQEILRLPEALIQSHSMRIMSLRDGKRKMSKSDPSDFSRINLSDSADQIYQKIKKAKTDNLPFLTYDKLLRPEVSNLIDIYSAITDKNIEELLTLYQSQSSLSVFKKDLAEILISYLEPISVNYKNIMQDRSYITKILKHGSEKARIIATKTVKEIKALFGFVV
jgi:tryptophanyl-tRNA synthetase